MQQQQQKIGLKESFNIGYGLLKCQATCVTPFIRIGFGSEALGFPALGAMVAYAGWVMATEAIEVHALGFWWFVAIGVQRALMFIRYLRGGYQHSRYDGYPLLTGWLCRSDTLAKIMEGGLVLAAGLSVELVPYPLRQFLVVSGVAIMFVEIVNHHYHQKVEQARRDSIIEMQQAGAGWERRM